MAHLLVEFLPLAIAAVGPVGMGLVILLLSSPNGLNKALAYLIAQALSFLAWGVIFLNISLSLSGSHDSGPSQIGTVIRTFLGILLVVLAARIYLTKEDPDAPPPRWMSMLDKLGIGAVFGISLLTAFFQLRFVLLLMVGANNIAAAQLSPTQTIIVLLILVLFVLWPQLLPLVVFLASGSRAKTALGAMNGWLVGHAHLVNAALVGGFGIFLLWSGLAAS